MSKKGLSFTRQRRRVLDAVFGKHNHFEAEELVMSLGKSNRKASRATVYRTLTYLKEAGLIREIDLGKGRAFFEHILGHKHHEHLYCERCGKIIEFVSHKLETAIALVARSNAFRQRYHRVKIFGLCKGCKNGCR